MDLNFGILPPSDDVIMSSVPSVSALVAKQDASVLAALDSARAVSASE